MLAGECPLCGALTFKEPSRLEDGAPAAHFRRTLTGFDTYRVACDS